MKIDGQSFRTIWPNAAKDSVSILDQTKFPHKFEHLELNSLEDAAIAISSMQVRGAPLVGATAAYGLALAIKENSSESHIIASAKVLGDTRPTAVNLQWALDRMLSHLLPLDPSIRNEEAWAEAARICDEDVENNSAIGDHGLALIENIASNKPEGDCVNILTHCNAGWLATVDWGTATSPIYKAFNKGIAVHVYVSETRPRNQGAYLTAWELGRHGVPHTLVVDNAGGHLLQHDKIDLVIVGSDRTTNQGDVCNKIGTYLKALAAFDNNVPFYVAVPTSSIDFAIEDGLKEITIEERSGDEVKYISGLSDKGDINEIRISPDNTPASNPAFDVTPGRLVTALITEEGIFDATPEGLNLLKQKIQTKS